MPETASDARSNTFLEEDVADLRRLLKMKLRQSR